MIAWARVLDLPPSLLWFTLPGEEALPEAVDPAPGDARLSSSFEIWETMRRRDEANHDEGADVRRSDFFRLGYGALTGALAPPLIHGWPDRQVRRLPTLSDELLGELRAQTEGFRWLDRQQGASRLLPTAARHARYLADLSRLAEGPDHLSRELGLLAADACHLVAYQAFDQGQRSKAIEWYRCSAELAARHNAQDLYVFAMSGVAYMHARNREGGLALSILRQLEKMPLSVVGRYYVAVYEAHAHAVQHDREQALIALDRARALTRLVQHEAPSPWLGISDESFMNRQAALILAALGDAEALGLLRLLEAETPATFQRYHVTMHTNFALAHARLGEVEPAMTRFTTALRLNRQVQSAEKLRYMQEVRGALKAQVSHRTMDEIDEMIRSTMPPDFKKGVAC